MLGKKLKVEQDLRAVAITIRDRIQDAWLTTRELLEEPYRSSFDSLLIQTVSAFQDSEK